MNEQLVTNLANNITWLALFCLVSGMLIGWYATFTHYRQKEREREAVEDYKKVERVKNPPKSDLDRLRDAMRVLDGIVDYYFIKWDDTEWTYNDGLNDPTLFYSCQSTVEEEIDRERRRAEHGMKTHAERLAEMEAEMEERLKQNERPDGLVVKLRDKDGNIDIETSWPKAKLEDYLPFVKNQMADCFTTFDEFRKNHPEFHEMHFMTEHTVWEKDLDEEAGE